MLVSEILLRSLSPPPPPCLSVFISSSLIFTHQRKEPPLNVSLIFYTQTTIKQNFPHFILRFFFKLLWPLLPSFSSTIPYRISHESCRSSVCEECSIVFVCQSPLFVTMKFLYHCAYGPQTVLPNFMTQNTELNEIYVRRCCL